MSREAVARELVMVAKSLVAWGDSRLHTLFTKLVPPSGKAATVEGEMVRAANRLLYRYYNDGDRFNRGYGVETAAPAFLYLRAMAGALRLDGLKGALAHLESTRTEEEYERSLNKVGKEVADYVESRGEETTPNRKDMFDYSSAAKKLWDENENEYEDEDES